MYFLCINVTIWEHALSNSYELSKLLKLVFLQQFHVHTFEEIQTLRKVFGARFNLHQGPEQINAVNVTSELS